MERTIRNHLHRNVPRSVDGEFIQRLRERRPTQITRRENDAPIAKMIGRRLESIDGISHRNEGRECLLVRMPEHAVSQSTRQRFGLFSERVDIIETESRGGISRDRTFQRIAFG